MSASLVRHVLFVVAALLPAISTADRDLKDLYFGEAVYYAYQEHYFEALERLGAAGAKQVARFFGAVSPKEAEAWCRRNLGERLVEVEVEQAYLEFDLRDNLQEARWFLKSLQSRHETLLKVAKSIIRRQHAFFDYGEEAMKPMVLRSVAEEVEMHESTISRVTTRKYMHTPRGIYEFKYFFSSHVSTTGGGEASATAISALIKKLIAAENVSKPLSDSKIANILSDQGINVARRTVAKYREAMAIPPSNERKRLA